VDEYSTKENFDPKRVDDTAGRSREPSLAAWKALEEKQGKPGRGKQEWGTRWRGEG
jgi:hypothetical protein